MPPTTRTPCEALMLVISAGRRVAFSFSLARCGRDVTDGEFDGASNGDKSFSLPSQRKVVGLYTIPLIAINVSLV